MVADMLQENLVKSVLSFYLHRFWVEVRLLGLHSTRPYWPSSPASPSVGHYFVLCVNMREGQKERENIVNLASISWASLLN